METLSEIESSYNIPDSLRNNLVKAIRFDQQKRTRDL